MITVKSWLNFKGQEVSYRSTCSTTKRKRKSLWVFILLFDRKGELQKGSPYSSNIRKIRILTHQFSCEPQLAVATSTLNRYDHLKNHCSQEALQHKPLTRNQYSAPTVSKPGNNIQLLPTILICPDFSQRHKRVQTCYRDVQHPLLQTCPGKLCLRRVRFRNFLTANWGGTDLEGFRRGASWD